MAASSRPGGLAVALALAVAALLVTACGCTGFQKTYSSVTPAFSVRYPGSWRQSASSNEYGPLAVFSSQAEPGAADDRITLQVTSARPRRRPDTGLAAANMIVEQPLGETAEGLVGHRWFVTLYPSAVVIEAYARPGEFDRIRAVGERMAREINAQASEGASTWHAFGQR